MPRINDLTVDQLAELLDRDFQPAERSGAVDLAIECLAALCLRARRTQTLYFECRDRGLLADARRLERRLDAITERILATSTSIAERTLFVEAGDKQLDQAVAAMLASERPPATPRAAG